MYPFKNKKAFTLPELIISISISSIVMLLVMQIYVYTSTATRRYYNEHELFENARIAMNFIETQIRAADVITLESKDGLLKKLTLEINSSKTLHSFEFHSEPIDKSYMRLSFGGQELAKDIKFIRVIIDKEHNLFNIEIETNNFTKEDPNMNIKPIIIKRQLSLLGKDLK